MVDRWDNIDILRGIDRWQQETYLGGPLRGVNGLRLMEQLSGSYVQDQQQVRGFIQELHIARDLGLITFDVQPDPRPNAADADPNWYVQTISDFALTVTGQDRARGRMVVQPLPDPAEDDGRKLSDRILRQVAAAITHQYAPDEVAGFLGEEGIPPDQLALPDGTPEGDAHAILAALQRDRLGVDRPHDDEVEARDQFLINKAGQGVFASMRAIEIRVRKLAGFGDEVTGVDLMNKAFGPGGPLTDPAMVKSEQEGTRALFAGAYAALRNPPGHRQIDYDDLSEAAEAVQTASLLMRILDRVEDRLLAAARQAMGGQAS